jgi:ABC-type multidrug transport system fused ATPase/permease subunit
MNSNRIISILIILSFAFTTVSCRKWQINHKRKRDAKEIAKKQRERDNEANAKYEESIRHQASIQSPKTRREMKKRYKQADRYNNHKKEFFLKRWFTPKSKRRVVAPE